MRKKKEKNQSEESTECFREKTITSDIEQLSINRPEDIFTLAEAFLSIESMTEHKLQLMCYYAKAWYLALYDENIIEENFQAWIHGPVNPELYKKYSSENGWDKIPKVENTEGIPGYFLESARTIYNVYGRYSDEDLEYVVHREEPYIKAREGLSPWEICEREISEDDMKKYYGEMTQ